MRPPTAAPHRRGKQQQSISASTSGTRRSVDSAAIMPSSMSGGVKPRHHRRFTRPAVLHT
jgi:hypothetical protein